MGDILSGTILRGGGGGIAPGRASAAPSRDPKKGFWNNGAWINPGYSGPNYALPDYGPMPDYGPAPNMDAAPSNQSALANALASATGTAPSPAQEPLSQRDALLVEYMDDLKGLDANTISALGIAKITDDELKALRARSRYA